MVRYRPPWVRRPRQPEAILPWVPILVAIAIMGGYVIYALMLQAGYRPDGTDDLVIPPPPPVTSAAAGVTTPADEQRSEPPATTPPATTPPATTPPPERTEPPPAPSPDPPPPPDLTGEYGIDATFDDVFIGKVVIVNRSRRAQDWTVELSFPDNVGNLNTFWVDGTPQPTLRESGNLYIFTSIVPVEGASQVILKFHFDRAGRDVPPTTCTVNGITCT